MVDISTEIQAIQTAMRGEEVRDSIIDALVAINEDDGGTSTLPTPTVSDAGKFLAVSSLGAWELKSIASAEEVSF